MTLDQQIAELKKYERLIPIVNDSLDNPLEAIRFKTALAEIGVDAMAESLFDAIDEHGCRPKAVQQGKQLALF
jgi:hypothetical protein